ncbi:MAG: PIG-L family deacetylase [Thermogemmatispora sp.]|uniref:PIG-L family deacetylase n=1 Tax=Thermogemmatispora sp. TaxID=1968838 RepID=UPI001DC49FE7|nr:PIG-L family deacetylase [Thermogemmatispora sp.]MBX5448815.1 PIG-L family deacetylase [Thermogemmatispora sp.]
MATRRLLGVFAHPDDEGSMSGAFILYGQAGVETGLVCATRGEVGEIADPVLATPENLGQVREQELRAAADVLGIGHLWFLDYRDSGMAGTPDNNDPRALIQAPPADVIGKLVAIIRAFRPQVMVTFDETGGYGHPDHIAIYRYTTGAFYAAADEAQYPELGPAHAVSKLYYTGFPRSGIRVLAEWLKEQDLSLEGTALRGSDLDQLGIPDEQISVFLDVSSVLDLKDRAWACHRTQLGTVGIMARIPPEIQRRWRGYECYQLAATRVGPDLPGENDLFAHIHS